MPILNTFSGGGGGIRIPLEPVTNLSATPANLKIFLSWTDPIDKVANPGGEMVAEWNYSVVVRNSERDPVSPKDGIEIVRTTSRNQYQSSSYTDELYIENGVTYHYAVFAVTTIGVYSSPEVITATPRTNTVEFLKSFENSDIGYVIGSPDDLYGPTVGAGITNHAIFTGQYGRGTVSNYVINTVYAYNSEGSLQKLSNNSTYSGTGGSFNGYAVFLGGKSGQAYNSSLSKRSVSFGSSHYEGAIATTSDYMFYAGGATALSVDGKSRDETAAAKSYDKSFTMSTISDLFQARGGLAGSTTGTYAIFAGGSEDIYNYRSPRAYVDAYDSSKTRTTASNLSRARVAAAGGSVTGYAFIAGGYYWGSSKNNACTNVDVYSASLTKQSVSGLSVARDTIASMSFDNAVAFAGGNRSGLATNNAFSTTVDRYDTSLTRTTIGSLTGSLPASRSVAWNLGAAASTFGAVFTRNAYNASSATVNMFVYQ